jgi:signal peptidase I
MARRIPTGSMMHTVNIGDRIFVNKLLYVGAYACRLRRFSSSFHLSSAVFSVEM